MVKLLVALGKFRMVVVVDARFILALLMYFGQ